MALYRENSEGTLVKQTTPTYTVSEVVTSSKLGVNTTRSDVTVTETVYTTPLSITISTIKSATAYTTNSIVQKPSFLVFNSANWNLITDNWQIVSERWGS